MRANMQLPPLLERILCEFLHSLCLRVVFYKDNTKNTKGALVAAMPPQVNCG